MGIIGHLNITVEKPRTSRRNFDVARHKRVYRCQSAQRLNQRQPDQYVGLSPLDRSVDLSGRRLTSIARNRYIGHQRDGYDQENGSSF
jgi:hypothetical protein